MVNFFNPWHKSYTAMTQVISQITHTPKNDPSSTQNTFIREKGHEYFQGSNKKERIYRINGWCSWIKYAYLKNFSSEWRECVLRVNQLSEKILVPRKEENFFYIQALNNQTLFSENHIEAFSSARSGGNNAKLYEEVRGKEQIRGRHIYRARGVFSWIKYAILKLKTRDWIEFHVKIGDISEKILVKRGDAKALMEVRYNGQYILAEMQNLVK